jgi:hypothetical protein
MDESLARLQIGASEEEWPDATSLPIETVRRRLEIGREFQTMGEPTFAAAHEFDAGPFRVRLETPPLTCLAFAPDGEAVGVARISAHRIRPGLAQLRLWVSPAARGGGAGRALAGAALTYAASVLAGERFVRSLGGRPTSMIRHIELRVRTADATWRQASRADSRVFLELFEGDYPSEHLAREVAQLKQAVSVRYGTAGAHVPIDRVVGGMKRFRRMAAAMGLEAWTIAAFVPMAAVWATASISGMRRNRVACSTRTWR